MLVGKNNQKLEKIFAELGHHASKSGTKAYLVGGSVRDEILKIPTKDYDIIIEGNAIEFAKILCSKIQGVSIIESFEPFKTVKIKVDSLDYDIELASARKEIYKKPATFPTVTGFTSIKEDLARRDFTINALLKSLMPENFGEIIDLVGGLNDIENKLIRVFHDQSFIDDPTRIYRAARFMAKFNFNIEAKTLKLSKEAALHPDFAKWLKKRKNRFQIELDLINELEKKQKIKALDFLKKLKALDS